MNRISLTVGDYSGDGHDRKEEMHISCSLDIDELKKAYKWGSIKINTDFAKEYCDEYEDNFFPKVLAELILEQGKSSGFITEDMEQEIKWAFDDVLNNNISINSEIFSVLWLCVARIGCPEMKIEFIKSSPNINIGGYGLFYA